MKNPKAFASYSWTNPKHQDQIRRWAEQLIADGVDVVLDIFDLKEGHDKYAFMERMVSDDEVTHVLVFCDRMYAKKADSRKSGGVGTESQIISREMYDKVRQDKFIPIVCEASETGEPCLPVFMRNRMYIDFSTPAAVNENWEQLVRVLYGKPIHQKPEIGKAPLYIAEEHHVPASSATFKLNALRQALINEHKQIAAYRRDFLDSCIKAADTLRIREQPNAESFSQKLVDTFGKLTEVRNHLIDWVCLESECSEESVVTKEIIELFEKLLVLKGPPDGLTAFSRSWFDAHAIFAYELLLYTVASLIRTESFKVLNIILTTNYLRPDASQRSADSAFFTVDHFYAYSNAIREALEEPHHELLAPAVELIRRNANRHDIKFEELIQADLVVLLIAFLMPGMSWYPQTIYYVGHSVTLPFFLKASRRGDFKKLATLAGVGDAARLREMVKKGMERLKVNEWGKLHYADTSITGALNLEHLDTLG
mgnify:CR=1 FL=1